LLRHALAFLFPAIAVFGVSGSINGQAQASPTSFVAYQQQAVNPLRPSNVPDEYVITPFGYFHPSCVQKLVKGERLLADGRIQHADGSIEKNVAVCNYPRYTPNGMPGAQGAAVSPEVNGWIENANITTGSPYQAYGAIVATWTVPPEPSADDGQWIFFFPGFEDINNTQSILQPVLQWSPHQWAMASWNCCLNNITTESPVISVNAGDRVYGSITSTCPAGTVSCATWNVLSVDLTTGESTMLVNTPSNGQVFNWAFGGVMEPYYIVSCEDYPPNRHIVFDRVTVFDEYLHPITDPLWSEAANSTQQPQCRYTVKAERDELTLHY
jgi:hypothetical protein